jgi:hypothetical protein
MNLAYDEEDKHISFFLRILADLRIYVKNTPPALTGVSYYELGNS